MCGALRLTERTGELFFLNVQLIGVTFFSVFNNALILILQLVSRQFFSIHYLNRLISDVI